jgi:hypothetical protein
MLVFEHLNPALVIKLPAGPTRLYHYFSFKTKKSGGAAFPELKSDIEDDEGVRAALCSCRGIYEKTGLTPRAEAVSSFPS